MWTPCNTLESVLQRLPLHKVCVCEGTYYIVLRNNALQHTRSYYVRTSMNTWIVSSIITNRASDRYFEHSKREYHEPHKDSWHWQDSLEALPPRGGGSAECPKKTRGEWNAGVENKNTQNTQIDLNKWKLGELYLPQTSRANPVQCCSTHHLIWKRGKILHSTWIQRPATH